MKKTRALMPDILRLLALFGIAVVNVQYLAYPSDLGFLAAAPFAAIDALAVFAVNALVTMKTYGLFAFMFGVGFAWQLASAERQGHELATRFRRRLLVLAALGVLHGVFFFYGDILLLYAVCGLVLYVLRHWTAASLTRLGTGLVSGHAVVVGAMTLGLGYDIDQQAMAEEIAVFSGGSFLDVAGWRAVIFALFFAVQLLFQGVSALGWFCLGAAAVKAGWIDRPGEHGWHYARRWPLWLGLFGSAIAAWFALDPDYRVPGEAALLLIAPLSTVGYLGLIAGMVQRHPVAPGWLERLLVGGRNSLSIYLGQSIVLSLIFCGYGLGYFNAVSPAQAVLLALVVTLSLIVLLSLWLKVFAVGPFEGLMRRIIEQ